MLLLIDNYDSFSYNLYQMIGSIEPDIRVIRNDEINARELAALHPAGLILSPGPGRPEDAGICMDVIRQSDGSIPILGVCLGHQAICAAFGAEISYAKRLMHGKQSLTELDTGCPLFRDCPESVPVARYHSLAASENTMPDCLQITARTADQEIMGVKHKEYDIYGVQFHPESILTPDGETMLRNFIALTGAGNRS